MNCDAAQRLLSAERDGALAPRERAVLDEHLAQCAGCRQARAAVGGAIEHWKASVANVPMPDTERAWQDVRRAQRQSRPDATHAQRWLRWTLPMGAAAALAIAVFVSRAPTPASPQRVTQLAAASAEYVEVPKNSSSMVYVDDKSGWLVVWAVNDSKPNG
jgi:predicted anti-sigma-YlaC factor YlaD